LKGSMCRPELALLPFFPDEICQRGGVDARARVARTGARASFFGAITYLPPRVASVLDAASTAQASTPAAARRKVKRVVVADAFA